MPRKTQTKPFHSSHTSSKDKLSFWNRFVALLTDARTRFVFGLLLLMFTIFCSIAFVSFFSTGTEDSSILSLDSEQRHEQREQVQNLLGLPGARLAQLMVDDSFGIMTVFLIALFLILSLRVLKVIRVQGWRVWFMTIFGLVWGSVFLGFVQLLWSGDHSYRWGGAHGEWLATLLNSYIHPLGVTLLLVTLLVIFLIIADKHFIERVKRLWCMLGDTIDTIKYRIQKRKEAKMEPEEDEELAIGEEMELQPSNQPEEITFNIEDIDDTHPSEPAETIQIEIAEQPSPDAPASNTIPPLVVESTENDADRVEESVKEAKEDEENVDLDISKPHVEELSEDDPDFWLNKLGPYDPRKDLEDYKFPSLSLLKAYDNETGPHINQEEQQGNANRIVNTLRNYGIEIESIKATVGPTVTLYEIVPKAGVRVSKIQSLENDIMLSLSATGIRIIAPMPGKGTIGIEVPNEKPQIVSMHSLIASKRFQEEQKMRLPIAYGKTITNEVFMFDLAKTPHLLVAGATGTGKSVAINAIITSLLYKKHPAELKLVMVDPKMVEFAPYKPLLRHYLAAMPETDPEQVVITDCDKVINTLNSLVIEMENRYKLLMAAGVRNLEEYNDKFVQRRLNPNKVVADSLHHQFLPYIVIIIDEYGDFIMQAGKQVETPIARITQKARAVGMHMILATQRPSVNIVTGVIKANIPTRIALRTQSVIDSRTVLDAKGAEQLIGRGDSLYAGNASVTRVQCALVDTPEVDKIVEHISKQQRYFEPYQLPEYIPEGSEAEALAPGSVDLKRLDPMFADVARYVVSKQEGSTSRLQRAFEIGYNRAGKLSDQLEAAGVVGPNKGSKGRDVLIQDMSALEELLKSLNV